MNETVVLERIAEADFHRGGMRCRKLFDLEPQFFAQLAQEVERLAITNMPSEVQSRDHVTNWTKPVGRAVQFSLLNGSGDFADTSVDHDKRVSGKSFHHGDTYPHLAQFIGSMSGATNMRLNGMSPGGGLSAHEEHVTRRERRNYYLRARFHLPIATNDDAVVLLDGQWFHFDAGSIYYFNNGCVHSAMNGGASQRYHLVWDMTLTEDVVRYMFGEESHGPLHRVPASSQDVPIHHVEEVEEYAISGTGARLYKMSHAEKFGIKPHEWQNRYQRAAFWLYKSMGRLQYDSFR